MAHLQSTTISGSINDTGSLQITGSTLTPPFIESSLTSSFSSSGLLWINADTFNLQYTTETSKGTIQSPASFMGAWSAGGALIQGRQLIGGAGTQNAGIAFGGEVNANVSCTEEYSGTAWAAGGAMIIARRSLGSAKAGTQNASLAFQGQVNSKSTCTEEYNGSSWSSGGAASTSVRDSVGAGTQNAASSIGGQSNASPDNEDNTEHYNGTAWANSATLITGRFSAGVAGTQNSALVFGGQTPTYLSTAEGYNGISWERLNSLTEAKSTLGGTGTMTAAIAFGGNTPTILSSTEEWNGISWVNSCNMITARKDLGSAGTQNGALAFGGSTPTISSTLTEEYTKDDIVPYTTCVWSSGAGNILNKGGAKGAGDANAALSFGGNITPSRVSCTEEYDGTNWSAGGAMINAVGNFAGTGTQNAALASGGEPATCCKAEEYNGSTWSSGGNLSQGGYGNANLGTQNDAINYGGNYTGKKAETYNGSSWSTISDMNCCRRASGGGAGTSNAGLVFGGRCYTSPTTCQLTVSEEWDGSSWSIGASYTNTLSDGGAGGTTINTALAFGGYTPTTFPTGRIVTEVYDGTSWSAGANAIENIKQNAGNSIGASAFSVGGNQSPASPAEHNRAQFYNAVCSSTLCNASGAWGGVASMLTHAGYAAAFGTQNAAVVTSGRSMSNAALFTSEEWNGSSWSTGGTNNFTDGEGTGRVAMGTLSAGLLTGGWPTKKCVEEYDGTSWTTANAMSICRNSSGASGTQTAALVAGGIMTYPSKTNATEEYDGTNWSSGGTLSSARYLNLSVGTQNDTITAGGYTSNSGTTCVEEYNGSSWSTGGSLPIANGDATGNMMGAGTYDATFAAGRNPTKLNHNVQYNNSVWAYRPQYPLTINAVGRVGTSNAGLMTGGNGDVFFNNVFEYNCTLTGNCIGAWSAGGAATIQRDDMHFGAVGSQNATALFSGRTSPTNTTATEEYDGTNWSTGGTVITARYVAGSTGTVNAGLLIGGNNASGTCLDDTEEYNGTSWASGGNLAVGNNFLTGTGTQNAGVAFGGMETSRPASGFVCNRHYDGSSWSAAGGSLSVGKYASGGTGTQNATLAFGGYTAPSANGYQTPKTCTEEYNGSAWSTQNPLLHATGAGNSAGTSNDALFMGGYTHPAIVSYNQQWNGIAWSMSVSVPKAGQRIATGGTSSTSAIVTGGLNKMGVFEFNCNTATGAGLKVNRIEVSAT